MTPSDIETCNLTMNMIDDELDLRLEVETFLNLTATLTILEATFVSIGRNIISGWSVGDMLALTSADNTTQNTDALMVGTVQNSCKLHYYLHIIVRYRDLSPNDSIRQNCQIAFHQYYCLLKSLETIVL